MDVQGAQHCSLCHDNRIFITNVCACAIFRARLSFNFLDCPACNVRIDPDQTPYLKDMMQPHLKMETEVKRKATQRLRESAKLSSCRREEMQADEEELSAPWRCVDSGIIPAPVRRIPLNPPFITLCIHCNALRAGVMRVSAARNVREGTCGDNIDKMKVRKITMRTSSCVGLIYG